MRKSLMNNIKDFVDTNVRHRIEKVSNNNSDFFEPDLLLVEGHFDELRRFCIDAEKRMTAILQSLVVQNQIHTSNSNITSGSTSLYQNLSSLAILGSATGTTGTQAQLGLSNSPNNKCRSPSSLDEEHINSEIARKTNGIPSESLCYRDPNSGSKKTLKLLDHKLEQFQQKQSHLNNNNHESCERQQQSNKNLRNEDVMSNMRRNKKLPIVCFLKFLTKSRHKLKNDSLLAKTLDHCSTIQSHLTKLYLNHERTIETNCLKPIRDIIDIEVPNVIKLRKLFIKSHNDLETLKIKYNLAIQKQRNQFNPSLSNHFTSATYSIIQAANTQQGNINNKLDQLRKEIDEATTKFEQARDTYATELYAFVCREIELVNILIKFYSHQEDYNQQAANVIRDCLPSLNRELDCSPKRLVFGTRIEDHVRSIGRPLSIVIELCLHLLYSNGLKEEGLFRVPGSSVKIKKLKNAIDAWFVTLASQGDLSVISSSSASSSADRIDSRSHNHHQHHHDSITSFGQTTTPTPPIYESGRGAMLAIFNLFKEIASHRPRLLGDEQDQMLEQMIESTNIVGQATMSKTTPGNNDSQQNQIIGDQPPTSTLTTTTTTDIPPLNTMDTDDYTGSDLPTICYDVHTIAGLLKLYLRELPEPLFTFELYRDWINATVISLNNQSKQQLAIERGQQLVVETHNKLAQEDTTSNHDKLNEESSLHNNDNNDSDNDDDDDESSSFLSSSTHEHLEPLHDIIAKLSKPNYDNLAHLIKFLHLLSTHIDSNKMSPSNLSITMAPSLIWAPLDTLDSSSSASGSSSSGDSQNNKDSATLIRGIQQFDIDESHDLNMQITKAGLTTSMDALVIENLIKNADKLFPGETQFQISFLDQHHNQHQHNIMREFNMSRHQHLIRNDKKFDDKLSQTSKYSENRPMDSEARVDRKTNSVSPTGISTTSSSSFSSSCSNNGRDKLNRLVTAATNSTRVPMNTIFPSTEDMTLVRNLQANNNKLASSKPQLSLDSHNKIDDKKQQSQQPKPSRQPPPIPPLPKNKGSTHRAATTATTSSTSTNKSSQNPEPQLNKPPAPPVPVSLVQNETRDSKPSSNMTKIAQSTPTSSQATTSTSHSKPASLRGTGSIPFNGKEEQITTTNQISKRPSVPPPSRPERTKHAETTVTRITQNTNVATVDEDSQKLNQSD